MGGGDGKFMGEKEGKQGGFLQFVLVVDIGSYRTYGLCAL